MRKILSNLTKVLAALAIALTASFAVLPSVSADDTCDTDDMTLGSGAQCAKGEDQVENLFGTDGIVQIIINVILFIVGILSVVMLIYGGIKYTTSSGDAAKVTSAKNTILYAIVGLVIAILAYAIVNFVISSLADD